MTQEPADDEEFICRPCIKRQRQSAAAKARHAAQRAEARRSSGAATPTPPTTPLGIQIKTEPNDMMPEQLAVPVEVEVADVNSQTMDKLNLVVDKNPDEPCTPDDPTPCTKEQPEITAMETDHVMDSTQENLKSTQTSSVAASDQGVQAAANQTVESEDVREAVAPMDTSEEIISVVSTPVANSPEAAQDEPMDVQEPEVKSPMDRTLDAKTSESMRPEHNSERLVDKSPTPPRALSPELGTLQETPIMISSEPGQSQLEPSSPVPSAPIEPSTSLEEPSVTLAEPSITHAEPSVTHAEPSVTHGEATQHVPSDTSEPTDTLQEPSVTPEEPCVTEDEASVTQEEPGVTQKEPSFTQALSDNSEGAPVGEETTTQETVEGDASELRVS